MINLIYSHPLAYEQEIEIPYCEDIMFHPIFYAVSVSFLVQVTCEWLLNLRYAHKYYLMTTFGEISDSAGFAIWHSSLNFCTFFLLRR